MGNNIKYMRLADLHRGSGEALRPRTMFTVILDSISDMFETPTKQNTPTAHILKTTVARYIGIPWRPIGL